MIYLDNNATTPLDPKVWSHLSGFLKDNWANPSSSYKSGRQAAKMLTAAREMVSLYLAVDRDSIAFVSGGTEANNSIIASAKTRWPSRRRLIIGATEHPSISEPAKRWRGDGGYVTTTTVDSSGIIDLHALEETLSKGDTALVSIMWANNETGVIAPMREIVALAHQYGALVHSDAVQAVGKLSIDLATVPLDFLSMSAHKFHGPKGIGAMFIGKNVPFHPLILGGGQELGLRSGTENTPAAQALGLALMESLEVRKLDVRLIRDAFEQRVISTTGALLNGHPTQRLDNTSSLTFPGLDAAGLLIMLDERDVCCSAGSACHSASLHPSPVLEAMGFDADHAKSTLRFSFSRFNTMEEAHTAAEIVIDVAAKLREMTAGGPVIVS